MRNDGCTDVPNTLALALTLWAGAVAAGTRSEVFLRIAPEAYAALIAFAIAFASAAVSVDARIRGWLERRGPQSAWLALLGTGATMVVAGAALASESGAGRVNPASAPWAPLLLFVLPVTLALAVSAAGTLRRRDRGEPTPPAALPDLPRRARRQPSSP